MNANKRFLIIVPIVTIAALVTFSILGCNGGNNGSLVASGTVEATEARLGFQAVGRIDSIAVHEGDAVHAGDHLATLNTDQISAQRQQAVAQAEAARARLQELESGSRAEDISQARAAVTVAQNRRDDAERDLNRAKLLREDGAVSQEVLDKAQAAYDIAAAQLDQAQQQLAVVEEGPRKETIAAQRALLAQAEAAVRTIDATIDQMTIEAPFDGVVSVRHREPGETVPMGSPVLTVMNPNDRWVRIYIPENRIGEVQIGQPATITFDTFPGKTFHGKVIFIASEAEFTPKSVQTTEERVKLVYAAKVRITDDPDNQLKPGVPADVRLVAEQS